MTDASSASPQTTPSPFTLSLRRHYAVAKRRGYNQAVRQLRELAPYSKDPAQVMACADLLATIGPDVPATPSARGDSPQAIS